MSAGPTRERLARRLALAYPMLDPLSQAYPRAPDPVEFVDLVDAVLDELVDRASAPRRPIPLNTAERAAADTLRAASNADSYPLELRTAMSITLNALELRR